MDWEYSYNQTHNVKDRNKSRMKGWEQMWNVWDIPDSEVRNMPGWSSLVLRYMLARVKVYMNVIGDIHHLLNKPRGNARWVVFVWSLHLLLLAGRKWLADLCHVWSTFGLMILCTSWTIKIEQYIKNIWSVSKILNNAQYIVQWRCGFYAGCSILIISNSDEQFPTMSN